LLRLSQSDDTGKGPGKDTASEHSLTAFLVEVWGYGAVGTNKSPANVVRWRDHAAARSPKNNKAQMTLAGELIDLLGLCLNHPL
jgi:hypothetical protein